MFRTIKHGLHETDKFVSKESKRAKKSLKKEAKKLDKKYHTKVFEEVEEPIEKLIEIDANIIKGGVGITQDVIKTTEKAGQNIGEFFSDKKNIYIMGALSAVAAYFIIKRV